MRYCECHVELSARRSHILLGTQLATAEVSQPQITRTHSICTKEHGAQHQLSSQSSPASSEMLSATVRTANDADDRTALADLPSKGHAEEPAAVSVASRDSSEPEIAAVRGQR